ncbi:MAG: TonB-dependent receptor [Halieaceae bacterium]|jgi:iron complex outermembrane recepter protein|nr:TonB-dependent receptor [Halieaceae bacterium]
MKFFESKILVGLLCTHMAGIAAAQNELVLEEVLVTAQKKVESLSDVPMTVEVVTGEQLGNYASFDLHDLNSMTAGLAISGSGFDTDIATRGLGTNLNAPVTPRVAIYIDQASVQQERGLFSGLYDLERFEVLRGPQGTLYGQASPAGAIMMQSRDPNLREVDGYLKQSFAERDGSNTQFGVSVPIIEGKLGFRVAGLYDEHRYDDVKNITLDRESKSQTEAFRLVMGWQPRDTFDLRLSYHDIEDNADNDPVIYSDAIKYDDRYSVSEMRSFMTNKTDYSVLSMNYGLRNDWVISSVTSYQNNVIDRIFDSDGSTVLSEWQHVVSSVRDIWNTELSLASQGNAFWDWTAGFFYEESKSTTDVSVETWRALTPTLKIRAQIESVADLDGEKRGLFMHNAFHISENGTITLGLRYMEQDRWGTQPFLVDAFFVFQDGAEAPAASLEWDGILPKDQESEEDAVTGTLKYQHRFADDFMAYASYDTGWRSGSANISAGAQPPVFGAFGAEDSENIELGFKWDVLDGRGLWNLAAYYQIYSDFQYQSSTIEFREQGVGDAVGGVGQASPVVNVDEVESYGIDSDFAILMSEYWTLSIAFSYNVAEFSDGKGVACTTGDSIPEQDFAFNTCDLSGERAGQLAKWSGNIATEYSRPMGKGNTQWYLRGLLNAESEYYSSSLGEDLDDYATLDLQLGIRSGSPAWDVTLWVKNVTEESALLQAEKLPLVPDYDNGGQMDSGLIRVTRQVRPRTVGVSFQYNF